MDKILLIESATDICAVGISQGTTLVAEVTADEPMAHTSRLTLMIEEALDKAGIPIQELAAVAISRGPGSYTALRVGAATAKGICFGLDIPLIEIDTLRALSLAMKTETKNLPGQHNYFPMIDARRMEVYGAVFNEEGKNAVAHQAIILNKEYLEQQIPSSGKLILGGNGAEKCKTLTEHPDIVWTPIQCAAKHLLPLARQAYEDQDFVDPSYFKPYYLKPPNITKPKPIWQ